jgi:hypothetical protein
MPDEERKKEIYNRIKVAGLLSLVPFVLAAGPFAGYMASGYLEKRFGTPAYLTYVFVIVGFAAGVKETIRIIKITLKVK